LKASQEDLKKKIEILATAQAAMATKVDAAAAASTAVDEVKADA